MRPNSGQQLADAGGQNSPCPPGLTRSLWELGGNVFLVGVTYFSSFNTSFKIRRIFRSLLSRA
jgi:hypothetical protein